MPVAKKNRRQNLRNKKGFQIRFKLHFQCQYSNSCLWQSRNGDLVGVLIFWESKQNAVLNKCWRRRAMGASAQIWGRLPAKDCPDWFHISKPNLNVVYNDCHDEWLSSLGGRADRVVAVTANVQIIRFVLFLSDFISMRNSSVLQWTWNVTDYTGLGPEKVHKHLLNFENSSKPLLHKFTSCLKGLLADRLQSL